MIAANSAKTKAVNIATIPEMMNPKNVDAPEVFEATPVTVNTPDPIVFPKPSMIIAHKV